MCESSHLRWKGTIFGHWFWQPALWQRKGALWRSEATSALHTLSSLGREGEVFLVPGQFNLVLQLFDISVASAPCALRPRRPRNQGRIT